MKRLAFFRLQIGLLPDRSIIITVKAEQGRWKTELALKDSGTPVEGWEKNDSRNEEWTTMEGRRIRFPLSWEIYDHKAVFNVHSQKRPNKGTRHKAYSHLHLLLLWQRPENWNIKVINSDNIVFSLCWWKPLIPSYIIEIRTNYARYLYGILRNYSL